MEKHLYLHYFEASAESMAVQSVINGIHNVRIWW